MIYLIYYDVMRNNMEIAGLVLAAYNCFPFSLASFCLRLQSTIEGLMSQSSIYAN